MSYSDTARKLRDGSSPLKVYPDEIAFLIADRLLPNIEAGEDAITGRLLPYLEHEAIARLRHAGIQPTPEPDRKHDPETWRMRWVAEAQYAERRDWGQDQIGRCAAAVLIAASRLRSLIEQKANPQMIAAISMLLICEAVDGGFTIEFLNTQAQRDAVAAKHTPFARQRGKAKGTLSEKTKLFLDIKKRFPEKGPKAIVEHISLHLGRGTDEAIDRCFGVGAERLFFDRAAKDTIDGDALAVQIKAALKRYPSQSAKAPAK
jgi:hypothetical protein